MSTKLKCILVDDEMPGLTYLKMLCEQLPELEVVKAYDNPGKFLSELPTLTFDLCILDIEMPAISGLHIANILKDKHIIFTTAYKEYAADAFDLDAIDYVSKPVQKERLQKAVQKAISKHHLKYPVKEFIQHNTEKGKTLIYFNQLGYVTTSEIDSRDKIAVFLDGTSATLKNISFDALEKILPPSQFCRINKKEVISISIIHAYSYNEITTTLINSSGQSVKLALSENYRQNFLKFAR
jgi:DNA-binding LytR/AlgR family response regulator